MRTSEKSNRIGKGTPEEGIVHRRGLLQSDEQRQEEVPVEFLIAFVRALIRGHPSPDTLAMAMSSAQGLVPITDNQLAAFQTAVLGEASKSCWPKGFF